MLKKFELEKRKASILAGITLFVIAIGIFAFLILTDSASNKKKKQTVPQTTIVDDLKSEESSFKFEYGERMHMLETQISNIEKSLQSMKKDNAKQDVAPKTQLPASANTANENNITENNNGFLLLPPPLPLNAEANYQYVPSVQIPPTEVLITNAISMGKPSVAVKQPNPKTVKTKVVIPTGSFVKADLLTGVVAPTMGKGLSDPVPVLMRVTDNAILPNFVKADIRDCFIIGDAKGSLSREMVSIRLSTLSCIKNDGTTMEIAVQGYVSGKDGKEGIHGHVVSKQAVVLGRLMIAGFLEGVANAFKVSATTTAISPNGVVSASDSDKILQSGLFGGAGKAAESLADEYINLANEIVPVIEVNAGQEIHLVFLSKVIMGE